MRAMGNARDALRPIADSLARFAHDDLLVANKELGRALSGTANDRQQAGNLFAGDEAELAA